MLAAEDSVLSAESRLPLLVAFSFSAGARGLGHLGLFFPGGFYALPDRGVELVFALDGGAGLVFHVEDEDRQVAFFAEIFVRQGHGEKAVEGGLAGGGFVGAAGGGPA